MTENTGEIILQEDLGDVISEKYLSYALSTIMSRSLPDVRDGLKPVHRRLLYAMQQLRLTPENGFKKCARVVGDVIGKYHPHGDNAVYDTLVRLAQNFSLRYPLIEGQGNFGSIDGDNAAAMRYTESRLTKLATYLMQDLDKDTVNFKPTYDDTDTEPSLMPSLFPNLLANGSEGIAVGMATSIPPHNLEELVNAMIYLVDHRNCLTEKLLDFVECPDFPTGGIITDTKENLLSIYETGRGSIKLRARYEVENLSHGMYQIIITEIPYQVQKGKLLEQIANLMRDKKLPLLGNIRDESTEDIRIVLEPRNRSCEQTILMESLFKQTDLAIRFNFNMNVIDKNGLPKLMGLKNILEEFLDHRFTIVTRRSNYLLNKINSRLEILEGLSICYLNLDEVIRIIRSEDEPKEILMKQFNLTDNQAEAILNMKLRSLRKLEEETIRAEHKKLSEEKEQLLEILNNEDKCWSLIKKEMKELIKEFGKKTKLGSRITSFEIESSEEKSFKIEAYIEKEPITIILSKQGWIRSVKNHIDDFSNVKFKEGDEFSSAIKTYTTEYIMISTSDGKFFSILADNITKGKGDGDPLRLLVDISGNDEVIEIFSYNKDAKIFVCSDKAKGFIVSQSDIFAQTKMGKQVVSLNDGAKLLKILHISDQDMVATISSARKILVFKIDELPMLKKGQGVSLIKLKDGKLNDVQIFNSNSGFTWARGDDIRTQTNFINWLGKRGSSGKIPPFGFPKNNMFL